MPEKIAFLGLGAMGFGMATNLLTKSHSLTGFDVWPPTLARFSQAGGQTASTPREAVRDAPYVIFMVATAAQAKSALFDDDTGAVHELAQGATVILCSTGPPEYTRQVREELDGRFGRTDIRLVDAPVSGGMARAANGTLSIFASGTEEAVASAKSLLEDMTGPNLWVIPGGLGKGTEVKMVHQVLAGIHITSTSEAMGFAAKLGLNTKEACEILKKGEGSSWMFENRTPHMVKQDDTIYSALNIIVKDVGIVTAGGRSAQFPLFLSSAVEQVLATGVSAGLGLKDDGELVDVYLPSEPGLVLKLAASSSSSDAAPLTADDPRLKLVKSIMSGIHVAAAAEAMSLSARVGLDHATMFEIIKGAAGSSWIFRDRVPQLLSGKWTSTRTVEETISELREAIDEAHKLRYPLHLAGTALQLFQLVELKGFGKDPDLAVSRVWDGKDGTLFPRS